MKLVVALLLTLFISPQLKAQTTWFSLYNDSTALLRDADKIISQMTDKVRQANPSVRFKQNTAIKNTTTGLIYVSNDTINLPFWTEVIPQQKKFFTEVAGGERQGKEVFGLFFNGFYLAHELGHSFADSMGKKFDNAYDAEYDANTIAILYWKASGETSQLKKCYAYAQRMLKTLKDPVPSGEDHKKYVTHHYRELANDPYKYGYIQFSQFVELYNSQTLPNFTTFIRNYTK